MGTVFRALAFGFEAHIGQYDKTSYNFHGGYEYAKLFCYDRF
jgi:hypothetical protein